MHLSTKCTTLRVFSFCSYLRLSIRGVAYSTIKSQNYNFANNYQRMQINFSSRISLSAIFKFLMCLRHLLENFWSMVY
jgi:hypothetical protein